MNETYLVIGKHRIKGWAATVLAVGLLTISGLVAVCGIYLALRGAILVTHWAATTL